MSDATASRIRALKAGLKFCSKGHRPVIQAMIDQLRGLPTDSATDPGGG